MSDPFDALARPIEPQQPRPSFARDLHARLVGELGLESGAADPAINLPRRRSASRTAPAVSAAATTPYLTVDHGVAAIEWYVEAFGVPRSSSGWSATTT